MQIKKRLQSEPPAGGTALADTITTIRKTPIGVSSEKRVRRTPKQLIYPFVLQTEFSCRNRNSSGADCLHDDLWWFRRVGDASQVSSLLAVSTPG